MLYDIAAQAHLTCSHQQHLPTFLQHRDGLGVERICDEYIAALLTPHPTTIGIDPEIPMIPHLLADMDLQRQFAGLADAVEGNDNGADLHVLANRDTVRRERTFRHNLLTTCDDIRLPDGGNISVEGVVDLDGHPQGIGRRIDELRKAGQRHQWRAELPPTIGKRVTFLPPMYIQRADEGRSLATIVVERQQLETGIVLRTQVTLDLIFITESL